MKPGIYYDMPSREYFADPCPVPSLTQSIAKILIDESPAHARLAHPRLNPDFAEPFEYEKRLAIGNAAHRYLIDRGKEVCIIEAPDFRTDKARATRDKAITDGYTPILAKHFTDARDLALAARKQLDDIQGCQRAFRDGKGEVVVAWEEDGIWLRTMIDWLDGLEVWDLKTSGRSASPFSAPQIMADAGWAIQAAMQERALHTIDPEATGRLRHFFVLAENSPPYALSVHRLSEGVLTIGRKQLEHAVRSWRICMTTGDWPGYPPFIHTPEYPGYREQQWLNREIAEEERKLTSLMGG